MTVVKKTPEKLGNHDLCPGCGHGIVLRLIEEVVEGAASGKIIRSSLLV